MKSSSLFCLLGFVIATIAVGVAVIQNRLQYQHTDRFTCEEAHTYNLKHPFAFITFPTHLEIYLSGRLEQGNVTVTGFPQRTPPDDNGYEFQLSAGGPFPDETHAYLGDWYGGPIELIPSNDAKCNLRLIYKVR